MKQIKAAFLALAILAAQPMQAAWYEDAWNWIIENKNAALCAVGIATACAVIYKMSGSASGAEIKTGPVIVGQTEYKDGWERTDLQKKYNTILVQPKVVRQTGVECGFCALRDSHNVRLNMQEKASISQEKWEGFFQEQKEFIVKEREESNKKKEINIQEKQKLIDEMKKQNPNDPQLEEKIEALATLQKNIDNQVNRNTTNGQEIEDLLNHYHEYYGFAAGKMSDFYMTIDDFQLVDLAILDIAKAKATIESGGIFTFFLGSMKQSGINYPSGFGHWISFTIRQRGDGMYEAVATDSLNNNRLEDPRIETLIANLVPAASVMEKPAPAKKESFHIKGTEKPGYKWEDIKDDTVKKIKSLYETNK